MKTSWKSPRDKFETAVREFIHNVLHDETSSQLLADFASTIAVPGYVNSLAQVLLKSTLPGVPDFYQGTEYWDFHLVDPDNRQPVDYAERSKTLQHYARRSLSENDDIQQMANTWSDALKQWFVAKLLQVRTTFWPIIASGTYTPLQVCGQRADHLIAFQRTYQDKSLIVCIHSASVRHDLRS